ncbi:MAG: alpha-amylase family glycosyl hydrolase [Syntrophorhabdaceae bacterium]|nr:alpha-amylase family glycosyl hydrolase [Syntrophorhabdaceae bacterium]
MKFEFHISRKIRDIFHFDDSIFTLTGNVIIPNIKAARMLAQKINEYNINSGHHERTVKAGDIVSMGLIDEILHYAVLTYREEMDGNIIKDVLIYLEDIFKKDRVDKALTVFSEEFPTIEVYRNKIDVNTYLQGETHGVKNREIILEEMLLLWLANMNPAFSPFSEFFDDKRLKKETMYLYMIAAMREFFEKKPHFGPFNQNLIDMLRSPAVLVPYSLNGQLEYIREHWGFLLKKFSRRILGAIDVLKEESKITFLGPGKAQVYDFSDAQFEAEHFTPDTDWMPKLVLMAKNIYVWLDQLSKKYGRSISKLNEIPDEELKNLKDMGFTGLWLIGIWERSPASQKIKQLCGNPEAVASAYSLYDYQIAYDLGSEEAFLNLKHRAWSYGIRLASDMVPNHVGIYSKWVIEHPDWFISLNYNPYPWYSFTGPDLSGHENISIQIEDHYYTRTDAAVVFRRFDKKTGDERYIYHGNDGTSMPWNDTAQLNYLNPEVREAMINTILYVAKKFPIIRFDAAMTLTKRHYQRLWFPELGSGGAIPTRSEFGMTKEEFDKLMPHEFWREVVDRVAKEAPDTLLLAEAFWLLEGYFVRTLGMHRVYNSAFMNMLRDEENAKYRTVIKNILEFDPEILRRFVNFMNNPDERTAVDQFGKGDKYFGICTLMVTMPGLPMFGHGQIEGFTEKYGMEYKRAYFDETPDEYLIERHRREIFPLLHMRHIFAGVDNFLLYDFYTDAGGVNEDVFAFSNRYGDDKALVVYNNKNSPASGWIKISAAFSVKTSSHEGKILVRKELAHGLNISMEDGYLIFKDHIDGLTYIKKINEMREKGLYIELGPYKYKVFMNFHEVRDSEKINYSAIYDYLDGRGTPSIEHALDEMQREKIKRLFSSILYKYISRDFVENLYTKKLKKEEIKRFIDEIDEGFRVFLGHLNTYASYKNMEIVPYEHVITIKDDLKRFVETFKKENIDAQWGKRLLFFVLDYIVFHGFCDYEVSKTLNLENIVYEHLRYNGLAEDIQDFALFVKITKKSDELLRSIKDSRDLLMLIDILLKDDPVQHIIGVNFYDGVLWFNKERFDSFLWWVGVFVMIKNKREFEINSEEMVKFIGEIIKTMENIKSFSEESGYIFEEFLVKLKNSLMMKDNLIII